MEDNIEKIFNEFCALGEKHKPDYIEVSPAFYNLLYGDNAPHPHDTKAPGLAGLLTREEYDEVVADPYEGD